MLTFEKVLGIFADYLDADETTEVYISRHGCVRVEFGQDFHYCTGEVCHTPKELFDLLADDYRTYLEIELTKGKREVTEDDELSLIHICFWRKMMSDTTSAPAFFLNASLGRRIAPSSSARWAR